MPMQSQPAGTSRIRLKPPVINPATGKPFPPDAFTIYYEDPDHGKVSIGTTHRVAEKPRRGHWEPRSVVPGKWLKGVEGLLEPLQRHNDAMEHLLDLWTRAKENGYHPPAPKEPAAKPSAPKQALAEAKAAEPAQAVVGADEGTSAEEASIAPGTPVGDLPEMPGVPVIPVPPGMAAEDFRIPVTTVDRADGGTEIGRA